jgi:hypothetical protein
MTVRRHLMYYDGRALLGTIDVRAGIYRAKDALGRRCGAHETQAAACAAIVAGAINKSKPPKRRRKEVLSVAEAVADG